MRTTEISESVTARYRGSMASALPASTSRSQVVVLDRRRPGYPNIDNPSFPASVTCGKIKVQVYGAASAFQSDKVPVPVSVGSSPLLNRASWVQPPYDGGECPP